MLIEGCGSGSSDDDANDYGKNQKNKFSQNNGGCGEKDSIPQNFMSTWNYRVSPYLETDPSYRCN